MASSPLKFGMTRAEVEYALDDYAPEIISRPFSTSPFCA